MPNHITTEVEITGTKEQIEKLIKDTKFVLDAEAEKNEFDFNGIIKMPEEVLHTVSPTDVVATQEEANKINADYAEHMKDKEWKGEPTRAISRDEQARRLKEYGAVNWYDWAYTNWGTKWNAYDVSYLGHGETFIVVKMDTAWDTPHTIWHKLEELGYIVKGVYYGEMDGFEFIGDGDEVFEAYQEVTVEYRG